MNTSIRLLTGKKYRAARLALKSLAAVLFIAAIGAFKVAGQEEGCDYSTNISCLAQAQVILTNITIDPVAPSNPAWYSIVCVGDTITASLNYTTSPSTYLTNITDGCTGAVSPNPGTGASPENVTNGWWRRNYYNFIGWQLVRGNSNSFSYTNPASGYLYACNCGASMPALRRCCSGDTAPVSILPPPPPSRCNRPPPYWP